jgi:alpha-glucosidase
LAGPAEYTVLLFSDRRQNTSWAHQVASAAILSSPLLTYAASPEHMLENPAATVIKDIPSVWDETIVLPGSAIGELAAYARRKGTKWFVAVMNGPAARKLSIPLRFLKKGAYQATVVKDDGANAASVIVEQKNFTAGDIIELDLVPGGGYIAEFE